MEERNLEEFGYPGYYISEDSRVWRADGKILTQTPQGPNKMLAVSLRDKEGKVKSIHVHRLVAQVFVPNPYGQKYVQHKDLNVRNNAASNLFWSHYYMSVNRRMIIQRLIEDWSVRNIMKAYGINWDTIRLTFLEFEEGINKKRSEMGLDLLYWDDERV